MTHLKLSNISKEYSGTTVVQDFNLDVEQGEFISFLGPSGCGKTTTLRMVAGFETPTTGTITINGEDITNNAPNQRNVGMIFQAYALFPNIRVSILSGAFLSFAIVMGEYTLAQYLAKPAFAPYIALLIQNKAYEPAAATIISFALIWACMGIIQLIGGGEQGQVTGGH